MIMPNAVIRATLALATAATLAACGGSSGGGSSADSFNDHGTKAVSGSSIDVEADNYYFDPSVITGQPGQQVTITVKNESSTEHNFTIKSQDVDQDIEGGKDETVTVTMPTSGTVSFFCEYHQSHGMAGELKG
jgi:plastocyanin